MTKDEVKVSILKELEQKNWSPHVVRYLTRKVKQSIKDSLIDHREEVFYASKAARTTVFKAIFGGRQEENVLARSLIFLQLYEEGYTLTEIGRRFGKNHATVRHSIQRFQQDLDNNYLPSVRAWERFNKLKNEKESR